MPPAPHPSWYMCWPPHDALSGADGGAWAVVAAVKVDLFGLGLPALSEKVTFMSTQGVTRIGYFWLGGSIGREVVPSCLQSSREI